MSELDPERWHAAEGKGAQVEVIDGFASSTARPRETCRSADRIVIRGSSMAIARPGSRRLDARECLHSIKLGPARDRSRDRHQPRFRTTFIEDRSAPKELVEVLLGKKRATVRKWHRVQKHVSRRTAKRTTPTIGQGAADAGDEESAIAAAVLRQQCKIG